MDIIWRMIKDHSDFFFVIVVVIYLKIYIVSEQGTIYLCHLLEKKFILYILSVIVKKRMKPVR